MSKLDLSGMGRMLSGDMDRLALYMFSILFVVAAVVSVAVAGISDRYSSYDVFPLLALPFAVIGVASYLIRRRWLVFIVVAVICVVAFLLSHTAGYILLFVLVCTRGAAVMSAVLQRWLLPGTLRAVSVSGVRAKPTFVDHLVRFVFGIPSSTDTRVASMDSSVRRRGIPYDEVVDTLRLALVPALLMWTALFAIFTFHFNVGQAYVAVFTVSLYIVALALPALVLRTLNVRFGTEGGGSRLFDGLLGTAARMSVPLVLMLIIVALALYTNANTVWYILASAVFIVVSTAFSLAMYYLDFESGVVKSVVERRGGFLPEDGGRKVSGRGLDGVPGTPRRDPSSCFSDQKY